MRTREPRASAEKFATRVAGGQTTRSIRRGSLTASWVMRSNSVLDLRRPFIFQLPATSGRRSVFAMVLPLLARARARAAARRQPLPDENARRQSVGSAARRDAAGPACCDQRAASL